MIYEGFFGGGGGGGGSCCWWCDLELKKERRKKMKNFLIQLFGLSLLKMLIIKNLRWFMKVIGFGDVW